MGRGHSNFKLWLKRRDQTPISKMPLESLKRMLLLGIGCNLVTFLLEGRTSWRGLMVSNEQSLLNP